MIIDVLVEVGVKKNDGIFKYKVPEEYRQFIKKGVRVVAPFGNMTLLGFIINIREENSDFKLKDIIDVIDKKPIIDEDLFKLAYHLKETTLASLISCFQCMLPRGVKAKIKENIKPKYKKFIKRKVNINQIEAIIQTCRSNVRKELLTRLLDDEIIEYESKFNVATKKLIEKSIIEILEKEEYRLNNISSIIDENKQLNNQQQIVVDTVLKSLNKSETFLLHGVTGSGKTECYINIIKEVLKQGKRALILVPEISLSMQVQNQFINRFNYKIAILHSGLSKGEKFDEWRKINNNEVDIVIGARSAIFAPIKNLGIIIIDEEHESTYKQDNNPKYHATDIAIFRSKNNSFPVILGSATPRLESYARAGKGIYTLLTINKRANNKFMPKVEIVDLSETKSANNIIFSNRLLDKIREKKDKNEQIILFLNRRGFSTFITCKSCGYAYKCPDCEISLTYYKSSNMLRCNYCGYNISKPHICSNCNEDALDYLGLGTEKLEKKLLEIMPDLRTIRMDQDTTQRKNSHKNIINKFKNHEVDVLIGTQMIAKGLDFPNVTLVGVVNADSSLMIPDFRSSEKTFSLLMQVSGRSGRSQKDGEVIIQTYNKDHYSIFYASKQDYISFYKEELKIRHSTGYSPFYYMIGIKVISSDYDLVKNHANNVKNFLASNLSIETKILGPTVSNVFKYRNKYRMQLIIKHRNDPKLNEALNTLIKLYNDISHIDIDIDINFINL